jgi:hypothetical protein
MCCKCVGHDTSGTILACPVESVVEQILLYLCQAGASDTTPSTCSARLQLALNFCGPQERQRSLRMSVNFCIPIFNFPVENCPLGVQGPEPQPTRTMTDPTQTPQPLHMATMKL